MATTKLARMVLDGAKNILGLSDGKGGTLPLGTANAVTKTVVNGKDVYKDKDGVVLNLVQGQVNPVTGGVELVANDNKLNLLQPSNYPLLKWTAAVGKVRNSSRNAKLLFIGDSTGVGAGAMGIPMFVGCRPVNVTTHLSSLLNKYCAPANAHSWFGDGTRAGTSSYTGFDSRVTFGAGWALVPEGKGQLASACAKNSTDTSNISFTPTAIGAASNNIDTFVIWYLTTIGGGVFSWAVDGGAATQVSENASNALMSVVVPAGALASHTLNIARVSGPVWILGVQAYDSTTKCIEVINGSINGATTETFTGNSNPWDTIKEINSLAPDLSVIQLQINDCNNNVPIATFKSNLQTLVNACVATGDVILRSSYPSSISYNSYSNYANQQRYRDAIKEVATLNGLIFDDLFSRLGTYEIQQGLPSGSGYADLLHPKGSIYAASAYSLLNILRNY